MSDIFSKLKASCFPIDSNCQCGWELPLAVVPMKNKGLNAKYTEDDIVPGSIVALQCPKCHRGHSFFQAHEVKEN